MEHGSGLCYTACSLRGETLESHFCRKKMSYITTYNNVIMKTWQISGHELESMSMLKRVKLWKDFSGERRILSVTSETPPPNAVRELCFGISYSKMCDSSYTTLLENEGKNKSSWWKSSLCHKSMVHSKVSLQTTGNKRHKFTTIYFRYLLAFYTYVPYFLRNIACSTLTPQVKNKNKKTTKQK